MRKREKRVKIKKKIKVNFELAEIVQQSNKYDLIHEIDSNRYAFCVTCELKGSTIQNSSDERKQNRKKMLCMYV